MAIKIKYFCDFFISLIIFIIILPLFLVIYLTLRISIGAPVFFTQNRPGLHEKIFKIYKFRTMNNNKDLNGRLLSDELRLTPVGKIVRKLSLDELPQLFNVLKGELSLVGPRPLLVKYLKRYNHKQKKRHDVRPGITGWAQVNGRNSISWEKKFELDIWYVENWSLLLDIKILFLTIFKVLKRKDINSKGAETMHEFMGSQSEENL